MPRRAARAPVSATKRAKPSPYTFDVAVPPSQAPRVAHHDAHLRRLTRKPVPDAVCQQIPLEAFGPVASGAPQRYFTHDNGGRPYLVLVDGEKNRATVRRNLAPGVPSAARKRYVVTYDKLVRRIEYTRFWNGYSPFNNSVDFDGAIGNTLLFETQSGGRRRYLLVAGQVYAFELPEGHPPIEYFSSPLGNNDVPYPYGWSDRYAYFLLPDPAIEFAAMEHLSPYVKTGDLASLFYGQRDWKSGKFTDELSAKQRAALVALPRSSFSARAIHTRNAELESVS